MIRVRRFDGLDRLPPEFFSDLFEQAARQSVFLSLPWFRNLAATVAGQDVLILSAEDETIHDWPMAALVLGRQGRTLGGLANYYTPCFGPAVATEELDPGDISRIADAFARAFRAQVVAWDTLDLQPLDQASPFVTAFLAALHRVGIRTQAYFRFGNWSLDVAGRTFAQYVDGLSSVLRKNIPYASRKLARTAPSRFVLVTGADGLTQAVADFEQVYGASWRDTPEPYPAFIGGLATTAAAEGWLRLGVLYVNDEPAAAQLWLTHAGVASIYKICYDERFQKLSVGTILTAYMMQHALDIDRVRMVDYLGGDDPYKALWMSRRQERIGVRAFNPRSVRGTFGLVRHVGGRFVKDHMRRMVARVRPEE